MNASERAVPKRPSGLDSRSVLVVPPRSWRGVNGFHAKRKISRLLKGGCRHKFLTTKTAFRKTESSMALIQTDRDNVVRLTHSLHSPAPIRLVVRRIVQTCECLFSPFRRQLARLAQWSTQRGDRTRLSMAERARQRRVLAQLSDRELRDIGLTRYDIEFVLRQSSWR
jgi:uncharacterized protein YjiS (DUF1127 family)